MSLACLVNKIFRQRQDGLEADPLRREIRKGATLP